MDTKVNAELLEKAKERYMEYDQISNISRDLNIPRTSLQNYVNKEWKAERELARSELFQELSKAKKAHFVKLTQSAIVVLARALDAVATQQTPPTVKEAKDVAAVMEALDKITRLDDASPTEIISQEKVITIVDLKEKLRVDPFLTFDEDKNELN